jgi:hypothetical protein
VISLDLCKKILKQGGEKKYSDDDVKLIREKLYHLARIEYQSKKAKQYQYGRRDLHKSINRGSEGEWIQPSGSGETVETAL